MAALDRMGTGKNTQNTAVEMKSYTEPFNSPELNQKYKQNVVKLAQAQANDPLGKAFEATTAYAAAVQAAVREKAPDPLQAGENYLSKIMNKMTTEAGLIGKTYSEMMDYARGLGYRSNQEKADAFSLAGNMSESTRYGILSGDTTSYNVGKDIDALTRWRQDNQDKIEDYLYVYDNPMEIKRYFDEFRESELPEYQQEAFNALMKETGYGYDLNMTDDMFLEAGKQKANYLREAGKYQVSDEADIAIEYIRRNTLEGAQEWAQDEPDNQEAKDNLWKMERKDKYGKIPMAGDFAEKSKAQKKDIGFFSSEDDLKYAYINNQGNVRAETDLRFEASGGNNPYAIYTKMKPEDVLNYNYLHAQDQENGTKEAEEFLKYISYDLDRQMNEDMAESVRKIATEGNAWDKALISGVSIPTSLMRGINYLDVALQKITGNDGAPLNYERSAGMGIFTDSARGGVMDSVNWKVNILGEERDLFDFLYGTLMSGADSMAAGAFGPALGAFILGSGAAESTMMDIESRGGSDGQAILGGAAAGVFEYLFEKVSLGNLWKGATNVNYEGFKTALKDIGREMGVNFSEEFFTEAANIAFDSILNGDVSNLQLKLDYYESLGFSPEEAKKQAAKDITFQLMEAGFGGMLMGGTFGAVEAAGSAVNTNKATKEAGQNIVKAGTKAQLKKIAVAFGEDTEAGKLAKTYNAETATDKETGKLFRAVISELPDQVQDESQEAYNARLEMTEIVADEVEQKLNELGEENPRDVAVAVTKLWADMELTGEEMQALAGSMHGIEVAEELFGMHEKTQMQTAQQEQTAQTEDQTAQEVMKPAEKGEQQEQKAEEKAPEINVPKVKVDEDGKITIRENETEVDLEDSSLSEDEKTMIRESQDMAPESAAAMRQEFKNVTDISAHDFTMGFKRAVEAYKAGKEPAGIYAKMLSESSLKAARAAAAKENGQLQQETQQTTQEMAEEMGVKALTPNIGNEAGVVFASVKNKMSSFAAAQVELLKKVSKELGVQVRLYDTLKSPSGAKANASYEQGSNIINLAIQADGQLLTKFVSHEVYHYIREWNAEGADRIRALVTGFLDMKDGYSLQERIREKIAEYERAGVQMGEDAALAALEEITADGLLDYIGTEENFAALAKENKNLATRVKEWIGKAVDRIRSAINQLTNQEATALRNDLEYLEARDKMMAGVLKKTAENVKLAQQGLFGSAKTDIAVQEYQQEIGNAMNTQEKQTALNGLVSVMLSRTQQQYLTAHPDADLTALTEKMKNALLQYGQGKTTVTAALEQEGFSAPKQGSHTMRVMSFIGQQAALMEKENAEQETKYSIEQYEKNGKVFSYVKADRQVITGNDPQKWGDQITKYINEEIRHGKDVSVKAFNKDGKSIDLFITENTAGKAAYWIKDEDGNPVTDDEYALKLRIEAHIDEAAQVSVGKGATAIDRKNHPFAKDGFNYRTAYFEDFDGKYYSYQISIGKNGKINAIYNVNRIKEEAALPKALKGAQPQTATVGLATSGDIVTDGNGAVNKKVFSLSSEKEETGTLVAVHNLTEEKLKKSMELGGFPMPSIAIAKAEIGHQNFGPISLVFGKDTIDPKKNKKNVGYTADAWTPTFPQIEYQTDSKKEAALKKWAAWLDIPEYYRSELNRALYSLEEQANKREGLEGLADYLAENKGMQAAYLAEQGTPVEIVKTEKKKSAGFPESMKDRLQQVIDLFDGDMDYAMQTSINQIWDEYGNRLAEIFPSLQGHKERMPRILTYAKALSEYQGPEYEMVDDYGATEAKMRESIDEDAFREWVYDQIDGIIIGSGIYNNKEIYTPSGNRRSFEQLHYPVTIENIVKAMAGQKQGNTKNISGYHGVKSLRASTAETFKSIDEMHAWEGRLQARTEEEANALTDALQGRLNGLINRILAVKGWHDSYENIAIEMDNVGEILLELSDGKYTAESIKNGFNKYKYAVDDALAGDIKALFDEIKHMPVNIFEAKPERAVQFSEVEAAIIPEGTSEEITKYLQENGIEVYSYEAGNEKQRLNQLNRLNRLKFSISEESAPNVMDDAELYAQSQSDKDMKAALMLVKRLHDSATKGAGYLTQEEKPAIQKGDWQKRLAEIKDRLLNETGSSYSGNALLKRLDTLFSSMDEQDQDVGDLLMYAREIGKDLLRESPGMLEEMGTEMKEALRILKNNRYYLTEDMKSEIRETYGSVKAYMQKNFGKLGIRAMAKPGQSGARMTLAEIWGELSQIMPGTFAADATEADMPIIVDAFMEQAGTRNYSGAYGKNEERYATDIGLQLILDYYDLPGALKKRGEMLEEYRGKVNEIRQSYQQKYEERMATEAERKEIRTGKENLRKEIISNVQYLNTRIVRASDIRHVPDELRNSVMRMMDVFLKNTSVFDQKTLMDLRVAYENLRKTNANEESYAAWTYDEDILNMIKNMEETINGRRLSDLTLTELWEVQDVVGNLKKMVVEGNEITINGRKETMDHAGTVLLMDLTKRKDLKHETIVNAMTRNITPFYFFKNLGGKFKEAFDGMRSAQGKWTDTMYSAQEYLNEKLDAHKVNDWLYGGENLIFTTARGDKIELTKGQAMSLYATWQRETKNKAQNANHLRMGGFIYTEKDKKKIKTEGVDVTRPHALTGADMEQISRWLGAEGIGFVNDMVQYLSNDMAKLGNEVSMQLYGYRKFTEGYYFPYSSSQDYLTVDVTKPMATDEKTLKSWGAAKKLTEKANNPIVINDFLEAWSKHVNQMATYASFTVPMETMNRLYNFKSSVTEDETPRSVKMEFKRAYGQSAEEYIRDLMRDIAGGVRPDERSGQLVNKLISLHKKNAVVASASVAIQQPSALMRAMALVSPRYFVGAPKNSMESWKELTKYSGAARVKDMGRFDTGMGRSAVEWLTENVRDETAWQRISKQADKLTGFAPEIMDKMTWGTLWEAVKREQKAMGVDITTEEGLKKCAQRFDVVADATQVYDSPLVKSGLMRSRSAIDKMVTAFMSEPTVSFNLLADAIRHKGDQTYEGRVTIKRAAAAYTVSVLFNAMLKSLITAGREDDEEKTIVEKYMGELTENFLNDYNPLNLIPLVRDAVSIFTGYDVERADMSIIADLQYSVKTLLNENKDAYTKAETGLGGIAALFGVPLKNILRDGRTAFNIFMRSRPLDETDPAAIRYSMLEALPELDGIFDLYNDSKKAYYQRMAEAAADGNETEYDNLERYMTTRKGTKEETVKTEVTSAMKKMHIAGEVDDKTAMEFLEEKAGKSKNDAFWAVDKWKGGSNYTKYQEFEEAVRSGKNLKETIRKYMDHGIKKDTLSKQITETFKQEYISLYKTNKTAFANLQARLLTAYEALGYDRAEEKKDMEKWLKE